MCSIASNISRSFGNKIVDHGDVVGASSVAVQPHLHSRLNCWLQWIRQTQLYDEAINIWVIGFGAACIRGLAIGVRVMKNLSRALVYQRSHPPPLCTRRSIRKRRNSDVDIQKFNLIPGSELNSSQMQPLLKKTEHYDIGYFTTANYVNIPPIVKHISYMYNCTVNGVENVCYCDTSQNCPL